MLEPIGWWSFDRETQTLFNGISGQRIRFEGEVAGLSPSPANGFPRLRFSYEDEDVLFPVIVTARRESYGGPGFDVGDGKRLRLSWSIDHNGAVTEWRCRRSADTAFPPYGLWRRADDALFDALACWPATEATGPAPMRVDSWGGWLNGAWSPQLRRVHQGRAETSAAVESFVRPYVEPLDSPAPSWRFVDAGRAVAGARLAGVRTQADGLPYLSREAALTGFETFIPHLRRSDGKAVMFPFQIRSQLDKDGYYSPAAEVFYADEDVFFRFEGRTSRGLLAAPGAWNFELFELTDLGVRQYPQAQPLADLMCRRKVYGWAEPYLQPLPRLAARLRAALIDGWLAWTGSRLRLLDDPQRLAHLVSEGAPPPVPALKDSGIDLGANRFVRVGTGYVGGRFISSAMTGYVQQEGWTEAGFPLRL
jgi:hypothetical protein